MTQKGITKSLQEVVLLTGGTGAPRGVGEGPFGLSYTRTEDPSFLAEELTDEEPDSENVGQGLNPSSPHSKPQSPDLYHGDNDD